MEVVLNGRRGGDVNGVEGLNACARDKADGYVLALHETYIGRPQSSSLTE